MAESGQSPVSAPISVLYPSPTVSLSSDGFISLMEPMPPMPVGSFGCVETYDRTMEYFVNPYHVGDEIYRALEQRFGNPTA